MSGQKIRTLLIEDSALMRILISDLLRAAPDIELVGAAHNGKEGLEKTLSLQPDVVISDMVMPGFDGLYAVKSIMEKRPTPIILLSSLERENTQVFEALEAGAFDFIDKPKGDIKEGIKSANYHLTDLVRAAAGSNISKQAKGKNKKNSHFHSFHEDLQYHILVIGASTGGPGAIESILKQLPANLAIPVVIAQHMPGSFIDSFAQRLNQMCSLEVKVAEKNEVLEPGIVYLAPGHSNMKLEKNLLNGSTQVLFSSASFKEFNNPSIDCLMESVAKNYGRRSLGVILTGMGKDGALGLKAIKDAGGLTIAQDEESCVVYGMPKAAFDIGASTHIVKLKEIPGFIISCF